MNGRISTDYKSQDKLEQALQQRPNPGELVNGGILKGDPNHIALSFPHI